MILLFPTLSITYRALRQPSSSQPANAGPVRLSNHHDNLAHVSLRAVNRLGHWALFLRESSYL